MPKSQLARLQKVVSSYHDTTAALENAPPPPSSSRASGRTGAAARRAPLVTHQDPEPECQVKEPKEAGGALNGAQAAATADPPSRQTLLRPSSVDLVSKVMSCSVHHLDARLERLRSFGRSSLEDFGDGRATRRQPQSPDPREQDDTPSVFERHHHIKFRPCPFVTPNHYYWPPYDYNFGGRLEAVSEEEDPKNSKRVLYELHADKAYLICEEQKEFLVSNHASVQNILHWLSATDFYHVPTLLQLSHSFNLLHSSYQSNEMADMALYRVGMILSTSTFPIPGTWREREILYTSHNIPIFNALLNAYHFSMRRGCPRSAFELCRLVLSLDRRDPVGALLLLDYAALRSKQWAWLLEIYIESFAALQSRLKRAAKSPPALVPSGKLAVELALRCATLPSIAFSAALASLFLDVEASEVRKREKSKALSALDASVQSNPYLAAGIPSTDELLHRAVSHFPHAAVLLVHALGGIESVDTSHSPSSETLWSEAVAASDDMKRSKKSSFALVDHLSSLFVSRHADLWRAPNVKAALARVLRVPSRSTADGSEEGPGTVAELSIPPSVVSQHFALSSKFYANLDANELCGAVPAIPEADDAVGASSDDGDEEWVSTEEEEDRD